MRVLVTGGSGRLGQFVVRELFSHGHQVLVTRRYQAERVSLSDLYRGSQQSSFASRSFQRRGGRVHLARHRFPYTESGFNVEAQSWEFADVAADAERFNLNVSLTNNVLAAAQIAGAKKIVCGSSLAVYGFYYPSSQLVPDYLPIDEKHWLRPQDPYGLTKLVGEKFCDAFSQKTEMQVASLRFSGVYTEEHRATLAERSKNPLIRGTGALWSYIDVRDAARACRLALEANFSGHQAFNICAPNTIMDTPTAELAERYLPHVKRCAKPPAAGAATISRRRKRF